MSKKRIVVFAGAGAALLLLAAIAFAAALNARAVKVAFYGVDARVQQAVKDEIAKMNLGKTRFFELDQDEPLADGFQKKYSILIAKNSFAVEREAKKYIAPNETIFEALPVSIRKATALEGGPHYAVPLLLDHFEISYYQNAQTKLGLPVPQSYGALLRYLSAAKEVVDIPLCAAGADDKTLLGFVSAMAEILYGADDYKKMLGILQEASALNRSNLPESLTRVLDEIKAMQKQELLYPQWTKATARDISFFMQERRLGAAAMFLSDRRSVAFNLIKYFDSSYFPRYDNRADHGIIAPQIVAALLSSKNGAPLVLGQLVSNEAQAELSNISLLAPTASRAEAVDRQADDTRFWAASSAAGALNGILEECCISPERVRSLAQGIRVYLEN